MRWSHMLEVLHEHVQVHVNHMVGSSTPHLGAGDISQKSQSWSANMYEGPRTQNVPGLGTAAKMAWFAEHKLKFLHIFHHTSRDFRGNMFVVMLRRSKRFMISYLGFVMVEKHKTAKHRALRACLRDGESIGWPRLGLPGRSLLDVGWTVSLNPHQICKACPGVPLVSLPAEAVVCLPIKCSRWLNDRTM